MNGGLSSEQVHSIDLSQVGRHSFEVFPGMVLQLAIDSDSTATVRAAAVTVRGDIELYASDVSRHGTILLSRILLNRSHKIVVKIAQF